MAFSASSNVLPDQVRSSWASVRDATYLVMAFMRSA